MYRILTSTYEESQSEKAVVDAGKRLALITGGGSGIGRGFALKMTKLNHIVIVSDVKKDHIGEW